MRDTERRLRRLEAVSRALRELDTAHPAALRAVREALREGSSA